MANYYTQFSFAIPLKTDEEIAWATGLTKFLMEEGQREDERDRQADPSPWDDLLPDPDEGSHGFEAKVDMDNDLWIYSEESGNTNNVIPFLQAYLEKFDPKGYVGFEYACTCSKPRLDAFGGGAVMVTVDGCEWINSGLWLVQQMTAHAEKLLWQEQQNRL